jgi:hypothetical protein
MNEVKEQTLIEALDLLEQGLSIDEIISRFPGDATGLRPLLMTASALSNLATQPSVAAEKRSKAAFLEAAEFMATSPVAKTRRWLPRVLAPMLAVLAVIFLSCIALVNASRTAVPGDVLYKTKRAYEEFRLALTSDPVQASVLREEFRDRRLAEVMTLLDSGREESVSFIGVIEAINPDDRWLVEGIPVMVDSETIIEGDPAPSDVVQVDGMTSSGVVEADVILVLISRLESPVFQETPTPPLEVKPVETPVPEPTNTITVLVEPTPTSAGEIPTGEERAPQSAATAEPPTPANQLPTTQPEPQPTSPPALSTTTPPGNDGDDDGDDGDDSDENGNDGGDAGENDGDDDNGDDVGDVDESAGDD